ncbi:MAG: ogr/Delta-like zinc finger family protein [Pseudomonadota bacterium]
MTTPSTGKRGVYRVHCPHCKARAIVRSSTRISNEVRQLHFECSDAECGHVFGATAEVHVTISHTIRPSRKARAGVDLRTVPLRRRADNDDTPPPANDDTPPVPAADVCGVGVPHTNIG